VNWHYALLNDQPTLCGGSLSLPFVVYWGIKRPWSKTDHSSTSGTNVKNKNYTPFYVFVASRWIKHTVHLTNTVKLRQISSGQTVTSRSNFGLNYVASVCIRCTC